MNKKYAAEDQLGWHASLSHWVAKAEDFITDYTGNHEIGAFGFRSVLPSDHTQNANCFHQVSKGGRYVRNLLQNMPGTIDTISRFYTVKQYDKLPHDIQQECEEVDEEDHEEDSQSGVDMATIETRAAKKAKTACNNNSLDHDENKVSKYVQVVKIERPMEPNLYKAYYTGDPFINQRVMVRDKDHDRLYEAEKKFTEGLYSGCIALTMTLDTQISNHMEAQQEYHDAKLVGRIDVLVRLVMAAVVTGGVSQQKYAACPNSRNYFSKIANAQLGEGQNVQRHLTTFTENMAAMRLSGLDMEPRGDWVTIGTDGTVTGVPLESPIDYLCAQYLIWSVRDRFTTEISALAGIEDGYMLKGPHLTYEKAVQLVKNWSANVSSSGITGQMNRATEKKHARAESVGKPEGKIMKTTSHRKAIENSAGASSGSSSISETQRSQGIHPKYKAFLEKQTCELCKQEGHVGSLCPDKAFTDDEKAACKAAFKKQKRKLE
jgi:hypothetical protein